MLPSPPVPRTESRSSSGNRHDSGLTATPHCAHAAVTHSRRGDRLPWLPPGRRPTAVSPTNPCPIPRQPSHSSGRCPSDTPPVGHCSGEHSISVSKILEYIVAQDGDQRLDKKQQATQVSQQQQPQVQIIYDNTINLEDQHAVPIAYYHNRLVSSKWSNNLIVALYITVSLRT